MLKIKNFIINHFNIFAFLMVTIVVFSLYGKTLFFDWTYLDDDVLILDKQDYLKFSNIKNIFSDTVFAQGQDKFCRPLLNISFTLDKALYDIKPLGYHLTNIIIHLLCAFLLFLLLSKYYDKQKTFLLVLIFAVHPSITQAVSWIPGRNDSLLALFSILSFIFFDKYIDNKKIYFFILNILCFCCTLLIKETAILLPLFYVFYMCLKKCNKKQYFLYVFIWLFMIVLYIVYRYYVLSYQNSSIKCIDLLKNVIFSFPVITKYIANICCPFQLSVFVDKIQPYYLLSISSFLIVVLLMLISKTKFNLKILFGITFFLLFLLPPLVMPKNQFYDHRMYLPLLGVLIIFEEIIRNVKVNKIFNVIYLVIFIIFISLSYVHSNKFQNETIFWLNAYIDSPNSAIANGRVADLLVNMRNYDKAVEKYLKAIELENNSRYYVNLSFCYIKMGKLDDAKALLLQALSLEKDNPIIYYNLANIYKYRGEIEKAKEMKDLYLKVFKDTNKFEKPKEIVL